MREEETRRRILRVQLLWSPSVLLSGVGRGSGHQLGTGSELWREVVAHAPSRLTVWAGSLDPRLRIEQFPPHAWPEALSLSHAHLFSLQLLLE